MANKVLETSLVVVNELEETLWNNKLELVLLGLVQQLDTLRTWGESTVQTEGTAVSAASANTCSLLKFLHPILYPCSK